jgi:hypothetical protein
MKRLFSSKRTVLLGAVIVLILLGGTVGIAFVRNAQAQGLCDYDDLFGCFFWNDPVVRGAGLPVCINVATNRLGRPIQVEDFGQMRAAIEVNRLGLPEVGSCSEGEFPIVLQWTCIGDLGGGFTPEELECKAVSSP